MPRCGSCHRTLEDALFAHTLRGALRRTCRACLVSFQNSSLSFSYIIMQNSDEIYCRRDKTNKGGIGEYKLNSHMMMLKNLQGRIMKVS